MNTEIKIYLHKNHINPSHYYFCSHVYFSNFSRMERAVLVVQNAQRLTVPNLPVHKSSTSAGELLLSLQM